MMPHIAGAGRADFNSRFSQAVGLDQFGALRFPFTDAPQTRRGNGRTDALLGKYPRPTLRRRSSTRTHRSNTGARAAPRRLIHTSIDGKTDVTLPANVRVYHFAGTQHGPAAFPPRAALGGWAECRGIGTAAAESHAAYDRLARGVMALDRWVRDGIDPPASKYPRLADGTLTTVDALNWPALPASRRRRLIPEPRRASGDGPSGAWPFLVPQVDEDGNELAGIRLPDQAVPIGTLTGWNFRTTSTGNPERDRTAAGQPDSVCEDRGRPRRRSAQEPRRTVSRQGRLSRPRHRNRASRW